MCAMGETGETGEKSGKGEKSEMGETGGTGAKCQKWGMGKQQEVSEEMRRRISTTVVPVQA